MWNTNGKKLLCFCMTLLLHFLCAGSLYLPVKWQWSLILSDNISFLQNRQTLLFLKS